VNDVKKVRYHRSIVPVGWSCICIYPAFALGFVHAQDRLWQMETMRRLGAGRLSEVLGPRTLNFDKWMRTLGLYQLAEQQGFSPACQ